MKVMSYNILCWGPEGHEVEKRRHLVEKTIKNINPDFFGVQEATPEWMTYLRENFDGYGSVGVGRDDGKDTGEYSAVFFKKESFELLDSGNFWLSETPEIPSKGWDAAFNRICSWALLKDVKTGEKFVHLNTHLDHIGIDARREGMKLIFKKAESLSAPVVVTGDFNFAQGSDFYKELVSGKLRDSKFSAEESADSITYNAFENEKPEIIDFIMVSPDFKVRKYTVVDEKINGEYPSDHYPVVAEIEL